MEKEGHVNAGTGRLRRVLERSSVMLSHIYSRMIGSPSPSSSIDTFPSRTKKLM